MDEIELLRRRLDRERTARKEAERIAEAKTRELYETNKRLEDFNDRLQELVDARTSELAKLRDQAVAANRAKSMFLANMSHELRTPLNAVIGYSEMILDEHADKPASLLDDVRKIEKAGKHLLALINDVLDLSKVEAGKMALYCEEFAIGALVNEVVETVRPLVKKSENTFELICPEDVGSMVTDIVKVRQVLFNVLSNAFKFTQHGHIELRVRRDAAGERAWFEVTDTGIGIAAEQIDRLFVPFSQGDSSTTRRFGGTGLGLALSQKFCTLLGGEISVVSEEGRGSTFRIWLPLERHDSEEGELLAPALPFSRGDERRVVLVVDDDVSMHEILSRHLASTDLRVVCTADPMQAVALARELSPVAITLDVLMPRKDGWSVLTELKQDPILAEIPVILLSVLDERGFGFALGASAYLVKPVPRNVLLSTLRRHVEPARGNHVLLVEDETEIRGLMARMLTSEGWSVAEADNGRMALDRLAERMPSVIVLDLMMPEMDGFEFLGELHRVPGGREVPVVVVTAKDLTDEEVAFFRTTARVVLRKCLSDRETLLREVQRYVALRLPPGTTSAPPSPASGKD